ncbi:MAG: endonuclease, partial [Deltaproteobacteria bacterium]|nr:endonuclease [Deltaproteobacteria bacterium]
MATMKIPHPPFGIGRTSALTTMLISGVLCFLLAACAADKDTVDAPVLADPTKADMGGEAVTPLGRLEFGGEVTGDFTGDDQLDGYTFVAEAGAVITLENSHRGTARHLDSTLFLYGPKNSDGFFGADPIAFDDDGGYGLHARIRDFTIDARGEYLALLGTYAGADRGYYRLTLTCEAETCEPPPSNAAAVRVTATSVQTSEDGTSQVFQLRLGAEPTSGVQVWIESDDHSEAVIFPTRAIFCAKGFRPHVIGCEVIPDGETAVDGDWAREVEVRVTGVRDDFLDGDMPFSVHFRVESDDPSYGDVVLPSIAGLNADVAPTLDYSDLDELTDGALLAALYARIGGHEVYGYQGINSARTLLFGTVDVRDGLVESLYTGAVIEAPGESILAYQSGFNTEHTWPQGQFDRLDPMVSDLHHIFAADRTSNSSRSSYDYGFNAAPTNPSSRLGPNVNGTGELVYQVRPARRGDVARAHFYMVARYALDSTIGI